MITMPNQVRITNLDAPEERYIAFSIEACLPEHREGYALALAHKKAVHVGKICYQPLEHHHHASQKDNQEDL